MAKTFGLYGMITASVLSFMGGLWLDHLVITGKMRETLQEVNRAHKVEIGAFERMESGRYAAAMCRAKDSLPGCYEYATQVWQYTYERDGVPPMWVEFNEPKPAPAQEVVKKTIEITVTAK